SNAVGMHPEHGSVCKERCKIEAKPEFTCDSGLVLDGTASHLRKQLRQFRHRHIDAADSRGYLSILISPGVTPALPLPFRRCKFGTGWRHDEIVRWGFFYFPPDNELEPLRQQSLEHHLNLRRLMIPELSLGIARSTFRDDCLHIESIGLDPLRAA